MQRLWVRLGLVTVCEERLKASEVLFMEKSTPEEWDRQGKLLFKKRIYEQALLCFRYANN